MTNALLQSLRPIVRQRVIDLVEAAAHDVSDWAQFAGAHPATNPKYCYEWCFRQSGRASIVCLWFESLREDAGMVTASIHFDESSFSGPRRKRISSLRDGLAEAHASSAPLRVIVLDGTQYPDGDQKQSVDRRLLDPVPWHVVESNPASGAFRIARGAGAAMCIDQFDAEAPVHSPTQRDVAGTVFVRNPQLRRDALARARGRCELCGSLGFVCLDGRIFLETHHVVPLSEGGPDRADNIVALCANHHREAHHGARAAAIRNEMVLLLERCLNGIHAAG